MGHLPVVIHPDKVKIQPDESRLYFFDANIWLEVVNPMPDLANPYLKLWNRLAAQGLPFVVVNPVLISEVFNTFLRIHFKRWLKLPDTADNLLREGKRRHGDVVDYKKHYRPSQEHKELTAQLRDEFGSYAYLVEYPEPDQDLDRVILPRMLANLKSEADFNDRYYTEFCKERNLVLVTHDRDFFVGGVEVITANPFTLQRYEDMKKRPRKGQE